MRKSNAPSSSPSPPKAAKPSAPSPPAPRPPKADDAPLQLFPKLIVHSEKKEDSVFSAVGVLHRPCPAPLKDSDDICIFSQERLCDCDQLGAIVFSKTWKGSLKWHFLCNPKVPLNDPNPKGVHLFDTEYLNHWVKSKGTNYIQCPLCKEGAESDKKVDEHEIDSLDQLIERRAQAKRNADHPLLFFVEQLMLQKICRSNWKDDPTRAQRQEDVLRDIISHWKVRDQISNFLPKIHDGMKQAVSRDMEVVTRILLTSLKGLRKEKEIATSLLSLAAKSNSVDCSKMLVGEFSNIIEFELRPLALLNAIKEINVSMVEYLLEAMSKTGKRFVCDDCFRETIKKDMVDVAKQIIIKRWHKPTDEDLRLCERLDGNMWTYLASRKNATQNPMGMDMDDENLLTLDDDEWGSDEEGDFSELGADEEW